MSPRYIIPNKLPISQLEIRNRKNPLAKAYILDDTRVLNKGNVKIDRKYEPSKKYHMLTININEYEKKPVNAYDFTKPINQVLHKVNEITPDQLFVCVKHFLVDSLNY